MIDTSLKDLKTLLPEQTFITSAGNITLAPFKFKKISQAITLINKYKALILAARTTRALSDGSVIEELLPSNIVDKILEQKTDTNYQVVNDIVELLDLSIKKTPDTLGTATNAIADNLDYHEVIYLLTVVVKQNIDFFTQLMTLFPTPEEPKDETDPVAVEPAKIGELESVA